MYLASYCTSPQLAAAEQLTHWKSLAVYNVGYATKELVACLFGKSICDHVYMYAKGWQNNSQIISGGKISLLKTPNSPYDVRFVPWHVQM